MERLVYVTPYRSELEIAGSILSEVALENVALKLTRNERLDPAGLASDQVLEAYQRLQRPCFLIKSAFHFGADATEMFDAGWIWPDELRDEEVRVRLYRQKGVLRHALAHTPDGMTVQLFSRDSPGEVGGIADASHCDPVDQIWVPQGYDQTYAQLAAYRFAINRKVLLLAELAHALGLKTANDIYEAHVTVNCSSNDIFPRFQQVCKRLHVKAIHIELPEGQHPSHLLTASFHRGAFDHVKLEVAAIAEALASAGFSVTRTKIEAMIRNSLVPSSALQVSTRPVSNYFEFHVKVSVGDKTPMHLLQALCDAYGAHLSRNPSNSFAGKVRLYFATLRVYELGRDAASGYFDSFLCELKKHGFSLSNILREYTVFDTNESLDDGWYPSHRGAVCSACELLRTVECPMV